MRDPLQLRLRRLIRALEGGNQTTLLAEAQGLLRRLQVAMRQASFLEEVSLLAHLPTQLTLVRLMRPPYRAALEGYLEVHRSAAVRLEEPALGAPLEQLPALYRLWGTCRAAAGVVGGVGQVRLQARSAAPGRARYDSR